MLNNRNQQQQKKKKNYKKSQRNKMYNIENIMDVKTIEGQKLYLIKWEGYGEEANSWEPFENLSTAKDYILELENKMNPRRNLNIKDASAAAKEASLSCKVKAERKKITNNKNNRSSKSRSEAKNRINNQQNKDNKNTLIVISSDNDDESEEDNNNNCNKELTLLGRKRRNVESISNNISNATPIRLLDRKGKEKTEIKDDFLEEKIENIVKANLLKHINSNICNDPKIITSSGSGSDNKKNVSILKIDTENNFTLNSPNKSELIQEENTTTQNKNRNKSND